MGIIPARRDEQLLWMKQHAPVWETNAVAVGLTPAQASGFQAMVDSAQDAATARQDAAYAAKAATTTQNAAIGTARERAGELLAVIKAFAEQAANPATVYATAQIPPPAEPGPTPAPGTPFDPRVELLQGGAIVISWKCANPEGTSGTIYEVRRSLTGSGGTLTLIGASGVKEFTDDTIPFGSGAVTYEVTGVRSTRRGLPAQFNVNFGVNGPGLSVMDVTAPGVGGEIKMAA